MWVCAAQQGRDFEAPDLELSGLSISEAFSRTGSEYFERTESFSFVSSHLKLFKDRLLLKIRFNALTRKLLYCCCTQCFSVQGGRILAEPRALTAPSWINRPISRTGYQF